MRILYIQQHFATDQGEAGVRGYNLVRTLADRGHDVTVLCGRNWRDSSLQIDDRSWVAERMVNGLRIVQLNVHYSNHQSFLVRLGGFLLFALLACWEATRRQADLIFASSTPLTVILPSLCARFLRRTPYVLEVRDLWPDLPIAMGIIRNRFFKWLLLTAERIGYQRAWKLVALAPGIKDGIVRKAQIPPSRVVMVPNGSDTLRLQPLGRLPRKLLPLPEGHFVLGYTGTHGIANGLDAVLDAAKILKRRGIQNVSFVLIGDGREKARLVQRAKSEGLDNVCFVGLFNKKHYNEVLAELDIGMQILLNVPEFYYGTSPNKFFDYLAVGKPVLINYPGWMSDLVTEHHCGVAVPPDDPEAFADAVQGLIAKRTQLPEMGRAARTLAERQFSQQQILIDLAEFIETAPPRNSLALSPLLAINRE